MDPHIIQTTVPTPMPNQSTSAGQVKTRFNLNHNFILVPAGSTNILANNGQMSNLIATNHNSIVNKGKIMILTTAPPITNTGAIAGANIVPNTGSIGPAPLATLPPNQCVQLRPNAVLSSNNPTASVPGTTLATSIIANIKMNPGMASTNNNAASLIQDNTAPISSKAPQTFQMLTPIVSTVPTPQAGQTNHKRSASARSVATKSSKSKSEAASMTSSSSITPVILNGGNLFSKDKTKPKSSMNWIHCQMKNIGYSLKVAKPEDQSQDEIVDDVEQNKDSKKLASAETLDRSSPDLWPEPVPGVIQFLANASSTYIVDEDVQDLKTKPSESPKTSPKKKNRVIDALRMVETELMEEDDRSVHLNENSNKSDQNKTEQGPQKIVKSFTMTPYGLESICDSEDDQDDDDSFDESSSDSEEPIIENNSTSKKSSPKIPYNGIKEPQWHRDFDEEEIAMLYGFGSLSTTGLLEKIKEIQNVTYQLGLEEERETARARYLNILTGADSRDDEDPPQMMLDQDIDKIFYLGP